MKDQNCAFEISLQCFQNPATLISIIVLLVNDHILKTLCPSWLTGKLSDFAGLFFFPSLVAATLGVILRHSKISARKIGALAFIFVGVLFSLLKVSPDFNLLLGGMASNLLGHPVHYAVDPTDLASLVMLLPAWKIWSGTRGAHPSKLAWIALSIASLASLATSPTRPQIEEVVDFVYYNDVLYATDTIQSPQLFAATENGGQSWVDIFYGYYGEDDTSDQNLVEQIASDVKPQQFPIVSCDPNDVQTCYRIDFGNRVEVSIDSGASWETAWQIPEGRLAFVRRKSGEDVNTYDMIVLDQNGKRILLLALGSEGVLRRELPDGEWERIGVGRASPTPYQEETFGDALSFVKTEHILWLSLALLYFAVTIRWHQAQTAIANPNIRYYLVPLVYPAAYFIGASIFYIGFSFIYNAITGQPLWGPSYYFFLYLPFFAEILASVRTDGKSVLKGVLFPAVTIVMGVAGNIIFSFIASSIIKIVWPSLNPFNSPNWINQTLEFFISDIPSVLLCVLVFWLILKGNIKSIKENNLGKAFFIHLLVTLLISVGSLFFVLWALGKIPWYAMAWLYAGISLVIFILVGIVISRLSSHRRMIG